MTDYGVKIAMEGKSIRSTDMRDFVLHSKHKAFKTQLRATATLTVTAGTGGTVLSIAHGLGYSPMFFVMAEVNPGKIYNIMSFQRIENLLDSGYSWVIFTSSDETNIIIDVSVFDESGVDDTLANDRSMDITYYVVIDEVT